MGRWRTAEYVSLGESPKGDAMKHVAFLTYNTVGKQLSSGWHDGPDGRRALLIQNSKGHRFAVDSIIGDRADPPPGYARSDGQYVDTVRGEIDILWGQLQQALSELDHVVVYVGSSGSEQAIALAAHLPATKVTFVGCDCGDLKKELLIQSAGLNEAGRVPCECGGCQTMERLFTRFMETGELHPSS